MNAKQKIIFERFKSADPNVALDLMLDSVSALNKLVELHDQRDAHRLIGHLSKQDHAMMLLNLTRAWRHARSVAKRIKYISGDLPPPAGMQNKHDSA